MFSSDSVPLHRSALTRTTGGILHDRSRKSIEHCFLEIDVAKLQSVYDEAHGPLYAEPEFVGKYLDTAAQEYTLTKNPDVLRRMRALVGTIVAKQRDDGYLGTYATGFEFDETFSVWNQGFTLMGLMSYYEISGDRTALDAATRCADYVASGYLEENGHQLLRTINQGIENSTILLHMARLYALTQRPLYRAFCQYIIDHWEACNLQLVSADGFTKLGCMKAAEMLICYRGLLAFGRITGQERLISAAARYWEAIARSQIGVTGNGSIFEYWVPLNAKHLSLTHDFHPNENCVAVCWMKLSADLFEATGESKYMDAFECTLYNHLLGAQAPDGRDFSYYQGNVGRKIHRKLPGQYSCCTYRGMNMLSHVPHCAVWQDHHGFVVALYGQGVTDATWNAVPVTIVQETDYPRTGRITLSIRPQRDVRFVLKLRIPSWCPNATMSGDKSTSVRSEPGFLVIDKLWRTDGEAFELSLDMPMHVITAVMQERACAACTYGPLVLAIDSRYGTPVDQTALILEDGTVTWTRRRVDGLDDYLPLVAVELPGIVAGARQPITCVDYASAGSVDHETDQFRIWLPVAG